MLETQFEQQHQRKVHMAGLLNARPNPDMPRKSFLPVMIASGLWLLGVGCGLLVLLQYSYRPGEVGAAPNEWPGGTLLGFEDGQPHLVMFLHPKCPCSRASVREFEEIVACCQSLMYSHIVFVQPEGTPDGWVVTDLWKAATAIPGVAVSIDHFGETARRFGACTSGHTLLFNLERELVFSGGITSSRGHEGDNIGRNSIVGFLQADDDIGHELTQFPVFGCPLLASEDDPP